MPGLYGFFNSEVHSSEVRSSDLRNSEMGSDDALIAMQQAMNTTDNLQLDPLFSQGGCHAGRVHLGTIGERQSPYAADGFYAWVEGEAYNLEAVLETLGMPYVYSFAEALVASTQKGKLHELLAQLDGYFCAVVYDSGQGQLHCITDRHGLRPLFVYHHNGAFAWASEVKGLLALDCVDKTLSHEHLQGFLKHGLYTNSETPFKHIALMRPATVLTLQTQSLTAESQYYWTWADIKPLKLSFKEAADQLGHIFQRAVERRLSKHRIGVALSGGLDSRALLAATYKADRNLKRYAYTFGTPGCRDHELAMEVAKVCGWEHEFFQFTTSNWFEPRIEKVWHTDGLKDLRHMHGGEFQTLVRKKTDINLNGYLGDVILGGTYLWQIEFMKKKAPGYVATKELVDNILQHPEWSQYLNGNLEAAMLATRGRRLINMGVINQLSYVDQRLPFMDNELIEFVFALPSQYRRNNKLYAKMLLNVYPDFFDKIPWAHTGKRVAVTRDSSMVARGFAKVGRIVGGKFGKVDNRSYTEYGEWIREPRIANYLSDLLQPETSQYAQFVDTNYEARLLKPHLADKRKDLSSEILRAATLEIYLRKAMGDAINTSQ